MQYSSVQWQCAHCLSLYCTTSSGVRPLRAVIFSRTHEHLWLDSAALFAQGCALEV